MQEVIKLIESHQWQDILNWGISLKDNERIHALEFLNKIDIDKDILGGRPESILDDNTKYYERRFKVDAAFVYTRIVCTRNIEDVKKTIIPTEWSSNSALELYLHRPEMGYDPLINFYKNYPPEYLSKYIFKISNDRFFKADFKLIWLLHENGWLNFDEEFFVMRLFTLYNFTHNHLKDAQFLLDHPKAIDQVFLKFYKYQIPVLDMAKSETIKYSNGLSMKGNVYWSEVFKILIEKKVIEDREIIKNLLESLLNIWKKPHLDWHVRLIELFEPTVEEYLQHQQLLFSCLHSSNVTIINFVVKCIHEIYKKKEFLAEEFLLNAQAVLTKEKSDKSILSILSMVQYLAENNIQIQPEIQNYIVVALLQKETKIQEKVAGLIIQFTNPSLIKEIITPYAGSLKQNALKLLNVVEAAPLEETESATSDHAIFEEASIPSNWDDLLYHIGKCISSKSALDIDLFIEGLNQLQNNLPSGFEKQLKPYTKKLSGRFEFYVLSHLNHFFYYWLNGSQEYPENADENSPISFLHHKLRLLFFKLKYKNTLPFLSTPTHAPFYIHPEILVDRLLAYESANEEADLEDLIISCNRVLLNLSNEQVKIKADKLKSKYAPAIQYLFDVPDDKEIEKSLAANNPFGKNNFLLPLWTQIARTKNPDKMYDCFQSTPAKNYATVLNPFIPNYIVKTDHIWKRLKLEDNWNPGIWPPIKPEKNLALFYYAASINLATRADISFQLSLVPNYADSLLCRYLPDTSSGNEVTQFEHCLYPMMALVEGKIKVHTGGWLYVAFCLLFEKKVTRDLAAEYLAIALESEFSGINYFVENIGNLIALKFAPINRLLEYVEKSGNSKQVKIFQLQILEQCILAVDSKSIPTNFKKLIASYKELSESIAYKVKEEISIKIKSTVK